MSRRLSQFIALTQWADIKKEENSIAVFRLNHSAVN